MSICDRCGESGAGFRHINCKPVCRHGSASYMDGDCRCREDINKKPVTLSKTSYNDDNPYPEMPESKVAEAAKEFGETLCSVHEDTINACHMYEGQKGVMRLEKGVRQSFIEGAKWAFKYMQEMEKMAGEVFDDRYSVRELSADQD